MSKYILTVAFMLFLGFGIGLIYRYENTDRILGTAVITYLIGTLINIKEDEDKEPMEG